MQSLADAGDKTVLGERISIGEAEERAMVWSLVGYVCHGCCTGHIEVSVHYGYLGALA